MKKIAFIVNGVIDKHLSVIREIEDVFNGAAEIKIYTSAYDGHIKVLATEAVGAGFQYIITVGGDGTINETVNGIFSCFKTGKRNNPSDYDWFSASAIKFGVLPRGTGNDFSRYFEINPSVLALKNRILE